MATRPAARSPARSTTRPERSRASSTAASRRWSTCCSTTTARSRASSPGTRRSASSRPSTRERCCWRPAGLGCAYLGNHEPGCRHRRRHRDGLSRGSGDRRPRDGAVPPDGAFFWRAPRGSCSPKPCAARGAYLRNAHGERFMERYDPAGELAPRDVVSRAIVAELRRVQTGPVYLDLTHLDKAALPKRFPRIYRTCLHFGGRHDRAAGSGAPGGSLRDGRDAHGLAWAARRSPDCTARGRPPAPACTARIGWRAIRCSRGWYSALGRVPPCTSAPDGNAAGQTRRIAAPPRRCPPTPPSTCAAWPGAALASSAPPILFAGA